jgi:acetylornithine deacetylase
VAELRIDRDRLVDWASRAIGTPSFTGSEEAMAELMRDTFVGMGLQVQWQQVEDGRANVLGIRAGAGGGPSLMFNGHMDTSYSGREPWLAHVPGFQASAFVEDGRLYGLGISNMKGALACYVEAVRALADARVRLRGDVMIAAVSGEIEKTQYGDAQGAEYRGYAAGSRHLVAHGGVADMCILGEPTESKVVLGHFGSLWLRISTRGPFVHTAFSEGKRDENAIVRMRAVLDAVLEWIPTWEDDPANAYRGAKAIVNVGALQGGFGWRVSRTPHRADLFLDVRVPPTKEMSLARTQVLDMVRDLGERFPDHGIEGEVYVTAPGAEIADDHPLVGALDAAHAEVFGSPPQRDVTRWFSDASVLTRYGIATVNYGTSTGLLDTVKGENLEIEGLVKTAEVYARAAMKVCGVTE